MRCPVCAASAPDALDINTEAAKESNDTEPNRDRERDRDRHREYDRDGDPARDGDRGRDRERERDHATPLPRPEDPVPPPPFGDVTIRRGPALGHLR